jgi:hypothetical protein
MTSKAVITVKCKLALSVKLIVHVLRNYAILSFIRFRDQYSYQQCVEKEAYVLPLNRECFGSILTTRCGSSYMYSMLR